MRDQTLETRLRDALRTEGDGLALTITAAELERRLALRRRGGLSPLASLGLAAAVGIALLGLVGVAGGWFEQPAIIPPSSSASPSTVPSAGPSGPATPAPSDLVLRMLPSLDDLLVDHDPTQLVRAQTVGPAHGPPADARPLPWSVGFAPIAVGGSYAVEIACLGSDDLRVAIVEAGLDGAGRGVPFACDGSRSTRLIDLAAGDGLAIASSAPASWRAVIDAPAREALRAPAIAPLTVPDGLDVVAEGTSAAAAPDYGPLGTGGGIFAPTEIGQVIERERYRVLVTCAGPAPIRYAFAQLGDQENPPAEPPDDHVATQIECDGAAHEDVLDIPLDHGSRLVVTATDQTAWHVIVTADPPPIALAPDDAAWTLAAGSGPNWSPFGDEHGVALPAADGGGPVRITVSCFGDGSIDGTIAMGATQDAPTDPFTLDCNIEHPGGVSLTRTYPAAASSVLVQYDPHGTAVWVAITAQVHPPASPAP